MNTDDKDMNLPGHSIEKLAEDRYKKSEFYEILVYGSFVATTLLTCFMLISENVGIPESLIYKAVIGILVISALIFLKLKKRANHAAKGAAAEKEVGEMLASYYDEINFNVAIPYYGDADIVLKTKAGLLYVIDVKSFDARLDFTIENSVELHKTQHQWVIKAEGQAYQIAKQMREQGQNGYYNAVVCFNNLPTNSFYIYQKTVDKYKKTKAAYVTSKDKIIEMLEYLDEQNGAR